MKSVKKLLSVSLFFLTIAQFGFGQESKEFRKRSFTDSLSYILVQFPYTLQDKDTVITGSFFFEEYAFESIEKAEANYANLSFKKGELEGEFSMQNFEHNLSNEKPRFIDLGLRTSLSGKLIELNGDFKKNRPSGSWRVEESTVIDSKKSSGILSVLEAQFNRSGVLDKNITFQNFEGKITFEGYFDAKINAPSGEWRYENSKEEFKVDLGFVEGALADIKVNNKFYYQLSNFDAQELETQKIPFNSEYLEILALLLKEDDESGSELKQLKAALKEITGFTDKLNFNYISSSQLRDRVEILTYPEVIQPVFPYKDGEREYHEKLVYLAKELAHVTDTLLSFSPLSISSFTDIELAESLAKSRLLRKTASQIADDLKPLRSKNAKFLQRDVLLDRVLKKLKNADLTMEFTFKDEKQTFNIDYDFEANTSKKSTEQIEAFLIAMKQRYDDLVDNIGKKLQNLKLEATLDEQEEEMVKLQKELKDVIENFGGTFHNPVVNENYLDAFLKINSKLMESYTEAPESEKLRIAEENVICYKRLIKLFNKTPQLVELNKKVHNSYHENELNPVTWTRMESTLHERLFNAYSNKLMPWAVEQMEIAASGGCDNYVPKHQNLEKIMNFMLNALENNPNRINRRLRNNDSVSDVIKKLEIELN
ncbi:MAG: hypothetical protein ACXITV_12015 [Luteibaculaceae bacterium]